MMAPLPERIPLDAMRQARERIKDSAIRTPMIRLPYDGPREIWLKLETLQPVGSFKIRGARNAGSAGACLSETRSRERSDSPGHGWRLRRGRAECAPVGQDRAAARVRSDRDRSAVRR